MKNSNVKKTIIISMTLLLLCFFSGCNNNLYGLLGRTNADPEVELPVVRSFTGECTIVVSWSDDPASDSYILQRKPDSSGSVYETVYAGSGVQYADVLDEGSYYYRLKKVRGEKIFEPSDWVLGYSSRVIEDENEPNDAQEDAVFIEADVIANMYYIEGSDGQTLQDADWYYITLPPRRTGYVKVDDYACAATSETTHMKLYIPSSTYQVLNDNVPIPIENPGDTTKTILFKVVPNPSEYTVSSGGEIVAYKILLDSIVAY